MFSLKYLKSSLQMPALFGGKPVSERTNKNLKVSNVVMIVLNIVVPILFFITIGLIKTLGWWYYDEYGKEIFLELDVVTRLLKAMYLSCSTMIVFSELLIASVLIYAVVRFRMIIGKYGLLKRVNYRMFIINAVGMGLYALSILVYVGVYYYFLKTYYNFKIS
jgi:hypothetical protein